MFIDELPTSRLDRLLDFGCALRSWSQRLKYSSFELLALGCSFGELVSSVFRGFVRWGGGTKASITCGAWANYQRSMPRR